MKLNIQSKLIIITLLLLAVPSLIIGLVGYNSAKSSLDELGATSLKNSTKQVVQLIEALHQEVEKGTLSLEEAQERVKVHILGEKREDGKRPINSDIDLGEHGYFFVFDTNGIMLAHPAIEGTDQWNNVGADGSYFTQDIINNGIQGGFTYYEWALPNNPDHFAPKIAYSELDPHWNWVVVAGSYMMDYNSGANQVLYILLITLGLSLIIGAIVIFVFAKHLSKPLKALSEHVQYVASGDLTVDELHIKQKDEIGQLAQDVNKMTSSLRQIIGRVTDTSQQVAATSEQLSASSEETSRATEEISQSIQEISTGSEQQMTKAQNVSQVVDEISKGIQQISSSIQEVTESSEETTQTANNGNQVVSQSMEQMNQISTSSTEMEKVIQSLGQKSEQIGQVISLITSIAEQTNLLALNAAIEAARAGEHGKGFAVVADEVRKLAEQSSDAGGQVNELIMNIQQEISKTVQAMDQNSQAIEQGMTLVDKAGHSFQEITRGIDKVSAQIQEISSAISQMNTSTERLVKTAEETEQISMESSGYAQSVAASAEEQNASMEEISSAADTLAKMAEELQQAVTKFKL